jgi:Transcriptional regulatory protein, C terminal
MTYVRFGAFTLDTVKRLLLIDGAPVALGPKVVETLAVLVENPGGLVTKEGLMERLWPNHFVDEAISHKMSIDCAKLLRAAAWPAQSRRCHVAATDSWLGSKRVLLTRNGPSKLRLDQPRHQDACRLVGWGQSQHSSHSWRRFRRRRPRLSHA